MNASFLWQEYVNLPDVAKWKFIKQHRLELLSRSDWTQLPDAVLSFDEKTVWQNYRQALRDLPETFTNPDEVVFPEWGQ